MSTNLDHAAPASSPDAEIAAPIAFLVRHGIHKIMCTVSIEALEGASGLPADSKPQLHRRSFDRFRTLIEAAAQKKLAALPPGSIGPITLSSDDLRRVPASVGMPNYAQPLRRDSSVG